MSYAGKYALAKHETLALKCEALERRLEEAREQEITFLNSLLWDMLPSDPTYKIITKKIEQLKEKGDE